MRVFLCLTNRERTPKERQYSILRVRYRQFCRLHSSRYSVYLNQKMDSETKVAIPQESSCCPVGCNLFPSTPADTDHHNLKNQRLATALFILMFCSSLVILMYFTVKTKEIITVQQSIDTASASSPNSQQAPSTCPCTQISIGYERFIRLEFRMHQICSSSFVTNEWFGHLQDARGGGASQPNDFRNMILPIFQSLRTMCNLALQGLMNSLERFYSDRYISGNLMSPTLFSAEMQYMIVKAITLAENEILSSIVAVQEIIQMNTLVPPQQDRASNHQVMSYGNCSCATSPSCTAPAAFYDGATSQVLWVVPGMRVGCNVLDALAHSTLECFYNRMCFNQMQSYLGSNAPWNGALLDSTRTSQFMPTSTVGEMLNALMVDEWRAGMAYDEYYQACSPLNCNRTTSNSEPTKISYKIESKRSIIYVVTTAIGLIGGLAIIFKMLFAPGAARL